MPNYIDAGAGLLGFAHTQNSVIYKQKIYDIQKYGLKVTRTLDEFSHLFDQIFDSVIKNFPLYIVYFLLINNLNFSMCEKQRSPAPALI